MALRDIFSSSPSSSSTYPSRSNYSNGFYSPQPSRAFSPDRHTPSNSQLTPKPSPAQSRMKPASVKNLLSGPISQPVSSWPTRPASEFARSSPPAEDDGSHEDQNGTLGTLKHAPPPPDDPPSLSKLTPAYFEEQLARREESLVLRDISPQQFREWEALHPTLQEADDVRYEYDSFASRMIVQCMPGPIHDSVQGYFIRRVAATMDRVAGDACDDLINVNSGTDFKGFKGDYAYCTRKQPDAYVQITDGSVFPTIVVETGWAENFEDLLHDARLWLLGTGLMTKVVIVVSFTERRGESEDNADDIFAEEDALIATVEGTTTLEDLSNQLLELHRAGRLSKRLLGSLNSTLHVFRLDDTQTVVVEDFRATVLPAPEPQVGPETFELTMQDVFGDSIIPAFIDPRARITFSIERLRVVIAKQIPAMERLRAIARAEEVKKRKGLPETKETFAVLKKTGQLVQWWA